MSAADAFSAPACQDALFDSIASGLYQHGYAVSPLALPDALGQQLLQRIDQLQEDDFHLAGIGRQQDHQLSQQIRRDKIHWLSHQQEAESAWLNYMAGLQQYLNRRLFLGLFSYECHLAHYRSGDFYKKHLDAFRGQANRILTTVLYLNPGWQPGDGGELVMYCAGDHDTELLRVAPTFGTLVTFLSEEYPHEVLPARNDRYSIAGWFRLNASNANRADPPR